MTTSDDPFSREFAGTRWWRQAAAVTYREEQDAFEATWRAEDFTDNRCHELGVCASPDGQLIGYQFTRADGTTFRITFDVRETFYGLVAMTFRAIEDGALRGPAAGTA